ncbi:MAG TPA: sulfatase-like hydrolase/transferase, partial [Pirellulales bacterium]
MPRIAASLCFVLALAAALLAPGQRAVFGADAPRKPNVVFFLADDLGWADLGCYGSKFHSTPRLDELAARGMRFTHAYAAAPVCSPTRAAIMTGKWPARLHLTDWLPGRKDMPSQKLLRPEIRQALPLEETTLAEAFAAAGYATGMIGKWHLGGPKFGPESQGFQTALVGPGPRYFAPYEKKNAPPKWLENAPEGEYLTDRYADEAVKFIQQHKAEPFFLYLPHDAPHIPLQAKPELVQKRPAMGEFQGRQNNPIYAAMLDSLD